MWNVTLYTVLDPGEFGGLGGGGAFGGGGGGCGGASVGRVREAKVEYMCGRWPMVAPGGGVGRYARPA
eukprot:720819-Prymnesium_polylepis.1